MLEGNLTGDVFWKGNVLLGLRFGGKRKSNENMDSRSIFWGEKVRMTLQNSDQVSS